MNYEVAPFHVMGKDLGGPPSCRKASFAARGVKSASKVRLALPLRAKLPNRHMLICTCPLPSSSPLWLSLELWSWHRFLPSKGRVSTTVHCEKGLCCGPTGAAAAGSRLGISLRTFKGPPPPTSPTPLSSWFTVHVLKSNTLRRQLVRSGSAGSLGLGRRRVHTSRLEPPSSASR
jgi:hypothetical protein